MTPKTSAAILLLVTTTLLGAACVGDRASHRGNETVDDASITAQVRSGLLAESDVNAYDIGVETYNGTVRLSGSLDTQWQIDRVVQIADEVDGVNHVRNDLLL